MTDDRITLWVERFWARVDKNGPTVRAELGPCWVWTGGLTDGYGFLRTVDGLSVLAHHAALGLYGRLRPKGREACHACDNRACVNPWHLHWGTTAENQAQKMARGRWRGGAPRGARSKLTAEQRAEVCAQYAAGTAARTLAAQFGVSRRLISKIVCDGRKTACK